MDQQKKMVKQIVDLQKAAFDGMMDNAMVMWDQTEKMFNTFMDQAVWLPEEGRKALKEWTGSNRKSCESFKNAVDEGFNKLDKYVSGEEMKQPAPPPQRQQQKLPQRQPQGQQSAEAA